MNRTTLNQFFKDNPTFDRPEWHALIRPCVDMVLSDDFEVSGSYLGGKPYLPSEFVLPDTPQGAEYVFIGQINLAELAEFELPAELPKTGVVSLFFNGDDDAFWGDDDFIKAYYFADTTNFVSHDDKDTLTPSKGIGFVAGVDLPCNGYCEVSYPDDVGAFYDKFYETFDVIDDHLFGYPANDSLGYDPTPQDGEWLPFINLQSHDDLKWCWHDGDRLMVFIEKSALARGDFTNMKADAG